FFAEATKAALYSNVGYLVGAGALRVFEKGFEPGPLSDREMEGVCERLRALLDAGALGLSMGLMYVPENYTPTLQLAQMCSVPASMGRIVTVHMRGEGISLLSSVDEVIDLAQRTGGKFHISHLKAAGKRCWNDLLPRALQRIDHARARGIDISFDVYPYCAGSTALYTLFPPNAQIGGVKRLVECCQDRDFRLHMRRELAVEQSAWDNLIASIGWQNVTIVGAKDQRALGRTILEIAQDRGLDPVDCAMDLLVENNGNVPMVIHSMSEADMEMALCAPGAIVISDALYGGGIPHPRRYGAMARAIHHYGRIYGQEKMVRACSALPAERMGLQARGMIQKGAFADLLLLDMDRFADRADYSQPTHMPDGIEMAIVNGKLALQSDMPLGAHGIILKAEQPDKT
ncbi:MAG: amidohydrolase family protein, partial [Clostridia bacterium]